MSMECFSVQKIPVDVDDVDDVDDVAVTSINRMASRRYVLTRFHYRDEAGDDDKEQEAGNEWNQSRSTTKLYEPSELPPQVVLPKSTLLNQAMRFKPPPSVALHQDVLLYLHGFPDLSVHPTTYEYNNRFVRKLARAVFATSTKNLTKNLMLVCFNSHGLPGSDEEIGFENKTLKGDLQDARSVIEFIKQHWIHVSSQIHLVGLSTGANLVALLRHFYANDAQVASCCAVAGLLDLKRGIEYDFDVMQLRDMEVMGHCWKEFYVPMAYHNFPFGTQVREADEITSEARENGASTRKIYLMLNRKYVDQCRNGSLDIQASVTKLGCPSLLVIHGEADQSVPLMDGQELYEKASKPKKWCLIPKGNHLLTNSNHLNNAIREILLHIQEHSSSSQAYQ